MNIILASHYFYPHVGGIESVVESHATRLSDRGHDIIVLTSDIEADSLESRRDGYKIQRYKAFNPAERFGIPYPIPHPLDARKRVKRTVNRAEIDIIHVHGLNYLTTSLALRYVPVECPVIMHQHTPLIDYPIPFGIIEHLNDKTIGRWNLGQANLVFCVSSEIERYVQALAPGTPTEVMPNGVNTTRFHPSRSSTETRFQCDAETPVFFSLSRMSQKKGIDVLLKAAKRLDREGVPAHVAVAGDGPLRDKVERTAHSLSNMEVLGKLTEDELPGYYATADCFLFTSKSGEAFPTLTMMEAYASGIPVIASKLTDSAVGVENGTDTLFVEPADAVALADAIEELALAPNRLARMKSGARETAEEHFNIESRIDKLDQTYQQQFSHI